MSEQPIARRPFRARGSHIQRCLDCQLPAINCICRFRVQVAARPQFWLLMHRNERYKPTNTGRLIADCLPTTQVFTWSRTEPEPALLEQLADARYQPYIIFPDDGEGYRHRITRYEPAPERIPVFLILDGTWRQARRMFRLSPYLQHLPVLPVRATATTAYALRKPASELHLCTAEVAVELLRMAQENEAAQVLAAYFTVFNQSYRGGRLGEALADTPEMRLLLSRQKGGALTASGVAGSRAEDV